MRRCKMNDTLNQVSQKLGRRLVGVEPEIGVSLRMGCRCLSVKALISSLLRVDGEGAVREKLR